MNPFRRQFLTLAAAAPLGALVAAPARAQPAAGRDYTVISPAQPVDDPAKIEVAEFFWYGCIHCYNLETLLEKWVSRLPADAYFRHIPAVFDNPRWSHDAGVFYALEALGALGRLHRPLFDAVHKSALRTDNPQAFAPWLEKNGLDPRRFDETLKSFGVQSKVKRAAQLTRAYRIEGTPTLAVHGRYTVSTEQGRSHEGMIAIAEQLVALTRKSPAKK